jgi:RHS repeat-associated protein
MAGETSMAPNTAYCSRASMIHRLVFACLFVLSAPAAAYAQSVPPPQTYYAIDQNGVDVVAGAMHTTAPALSIGQPGLGGLTYVRTYDSSVQGWRDNVTGTINSSGAVYTVTLMGASETFLLSSGAYTSMEGRGGTLTLSSNIWTYTTASGAVALYDQTLDSEQPTEANQGRVTQLTLASGERLTFTYKELKAEVPPDPPTFLAHRLQSVQNNLGYQLSFEYETSDADASGLNLVEVTAINNAEAYCDPTANGCGLSGWPTLTFATSGAFVTVTDPSGLATRYELDSGRIKAIRWPSSTSDNVTISYNSGSSRVQLYTIVGAGTWTYTFSSGGATSTAQVLAPGYTDADIFTSSNTSGRVITFSNPAGHVENYQYDGQGRLTRITYPEGNYVQYTYDSRGNITQTRQVAKSGSGLADIVTSAAYPATCVSPVTPATCNQPTATTDARGFRTDYVYNTTHGGVISVTAPAPTGSTPVGSGTRPQTRYAYTLLYADYIQTSGGTATQAPTGVYRLTSTSACATSSSCSGGADETVSSIGYDTTGTLNNVLPTLMSAGSGNGMLTTTTTNAFDKFGNLTSADGPLSGDVTTYHYDAARRPLGMVGPDPDSGGALLNRAIRYDYDDHGWVEAIERGTASGGVWANFSALERLDVVYDAAGRRAQQRFAAGGSTHAVTQYSYDASSRLDCVAVRMNPSEFSSLPASACTLDTEGSHGPDRISRYFYDNAGRVNRVASGVGTAAQQDTLTQMFTNNGRLDRLWDANANQTTYEYDGHDRVRKIRFPNASGGGSSTTDYEQYSYDANSNVIEDQRRDGATIAYGYDNLSRVSSMDPSSGDTVSYTYDNFSRLTQAAFTGHTLTFGYDQLSRNTGAGGPQGNVSYQYDLAGRRTRMDWPGSPSLYALYDYDLTGAVTAIRENGVTSGDGVLASYAYDNLGRRVSTVRAGGNGATTTYDYDAAGRLEELAQQLDSPNAVSFDFGYNTASQAIDRDRTATNSAYVWPQPANNVQNATANGLNQIAQQSGTNFTYDGRGNLTSATGTPTYQYDVYNRLTGAGSATLNYDPAGRLYQTTSDGSTVTARFLYDGAAIIAEYDGSNALLHRYVHGPGVDEPIVSYDAANNRSWLHQDQLGSVIAASNANGALIGSPNTYDEYGVPGSANAGRFQYTGQAWLPEASLYHYKARAYLPALGRFAQSDPILYRGGMNLYVYVASDPINFVDPSGLDDDIIIPGTRHMSPEDRERSLAAYAMWASHWDAIDRVIAAIRAIGIYPEEQVTDDAEIVVTAEATCPPGTICYSGDSLFVRTQTRPNSRHAACTEAVYLCLSNPNVRPNPETGASPHERCMNAELMCNGIVSGPSLQAPRTEFFVTYPDGTVVLIRNGQAAVVIVGGTRGRR